MKEKMDGLRLRAANVNDADLIYNWANDEEVRKNSFNTEQIPYENHCKWFDSKLKSTNSEIYILCSESENIGQVRLDYNNGEYLISYMVSKAHRGKGLAYKMLELLEDSLKSGVLVKGEMSAKWVVREGEKLVAEVKNENIPSLKVFEKLGYQAIKKDDITVFIKEL